MQKSTPISRKIRILKIFTGEIVFYRKLLGPKLSEWQQKAPGNPGACSPAYLYLSAVLFIDYFDLSTAVLISAVDTDIFFNLSTGRNRCNGPLILYTDASGHISIIHCFSEFILCQILYGGYTLNTKT